MSAPLGLPDGSVRAIISIGLAVTTAAMFLLHGEAPEQLLLLTTGVVGYYFGARTQAPEPPTVVTVEAPALPPPFKGEVG